MASRILIDGRKLGDGGIGVYIENLVDGLIELRNSDYFTGALTVLTPPLSRCTPDSLAAVERWGKDVRCVEESIGKYSASELVLPLLRQALLSEHDLYHAPHFTLPLWLKIPSVVTVHDTIHLSQPERSYHRPIGKMLIGSALRRASGIITVSRASANEIRRHFPRIKTSVAIVPNALRRGFDPSQIVAAGQTPERGHLLFVGTGRPHKGFLEFLFMLQLLRQELPRGMSELSCVVVGHRFEQYSEIIDRLDLREIISFAGSPALEVLRELYSGAATVVVPSRIEGFGLVALEAMACGAPVVCSGIPSFHEVCNDCAWYSAGTSARDLAVAVRAALDNDLERARKCQRGAERAVLFSRGMAARRTLDVYQRVLGKVMTRAEPVSPPERLWQVQ